MQPSTLVTLVASAVLGSACAETTVDPQGPGATGTIALAEGVAFEGLIALELRAFPDDGEELEVPETQPAPRAQRLSGLTNASFPIDYLVGGGIGISREQRWRALAWLTTSETSESPEAVEPAASAVFDLLDCGDIVDESFCAVTTDVDITIAAR